MTTASRRLTELYTPTALVENGIGFLTVESAAR
jgi:hypothetical protein